ncbi:MAG: hypothetical protein JWM44_3197 [Bacilli bacterium]|nr:hypothetical protein [Bacilli bacterium]
MSRTSLIKEKLGLRVLMDLFNNNRLITVAK